MDMKSKLSTSWIFVSLNYLYCDVSSLMDPELLPQTPQERLRPYSLTPMFLLSADSSLRFSSRWFSCPRCCRTQANRWANIVAGIVYHHDTTGNTVRRRASTRAMPSSVLSR